MATMKTQKNFEIKIRKYISRLVVVVVVVVVVASSISILTALQLVVVEVV